MSFVLPEWIDKDVWEDFLEMRKKKRAKPTDRAVELLIKELEKLKQDGDDPNEVLSRSIMSNWTGVFSLNRSTNGVRPGAKTAPTSERMREAKRVRDNAKS